jgi:hypothetical protein
MYSCNPSRSASSPRFVFAPENGVQFVDLSLAVPVRRGGSASRALHSSAGAIPDSDHAHPARPRNHPGGAKRPGSANSSLPGPPSSPHRGLLTIPPLGAEQPTAEEATALSGGKQLPRGGSRPNLLTFGSPRGGIAPSLATQTTPWRSNQDTWDGRRPMRLLHHTTCDSFLLTPRNVRRKVRQSGPAAAEVGMSDDADDTDKGVGPVQRAES